MNREYVVFSDLDGSLLNHEDYSYEEAKPMLEFLKSREIPLIFTTSKTKKECEILQKQMSISAPFIVENGAAIYNLSDKVEFLGIEQKAIKVFIDSVVDEFNILSFSNMEIEEIMEHTLFDYESARCAKNRDFSEPFLIYDEQRLTELEVLAEANGMKILKGGRFYHCVGINQDKGEAVKKALKHYPSRTSIALGDNYNDVSMLKVVNIPVLIPHHKGRHIDIDIKNLIKAPHKGSLGWNEALKMILF